MRCAQPTLLWSNALLRSNKARSTTLARRRERTDDDAKLRLIFGYQIQFFVTAARRLLKSHMAFLRAASQHLHTSQWIGMMPVRFENLFDPKLIKHKNFSRTVLSFARIGA
jgi:hypothetical protein